MDHSLINKNQIKMTGMPVSDNPFDKIWNLGIAHKKVFITFNTDITTVYIESRVPIQRDITECTHIIMTDEI